MQMKYATRDIYMYLPTHLVADYQTKLLFILHKGERKKRTSFLIQLVNVGTEVNV